MIYLTLFILGTILGSFFSLIGERMPLDLSILAPRSHCPHCQTNLQLNDLIPILSFLTLKGRCRYCKESISSVSTLVEIGCGCLLMMIGWLMTRQYVDMFLLVFICMIVLLSITDYLYLIIEPKIFWFFTYLLLVLALLSGKFMSLHFIEAIICFIILSLLQRVIFAGFGAGDTKLLTVWTLLFGYEPTCLVVIVASCVAITLFSLKKIIKKTRGPVLIPLVPFLLVGLIFYLVYFSV